MSLPGLYALLAMAALAGVLLLYRRWEPRGRGRMLLGALRWAAFLLVLLLLFNPLVSRQDHGAGHPAVLLDGSLSMVMPGRTGVTAWQQALALAREYGATGVTVFGADAVSTPLNTLGAVPPGASTSLLAPALRLAAEEGTRQVLVLSDGRIGDAAQAERLARDMGLRLDVARVGDGAIDYALAELDAPAWVEAGKPVPVRIGVVASGPGTADTALSVVLREDGRVVARGSVKAPTAGRVSSVVLRFTAEANADRLARVEAEVAGGDAVAAAALLSLHPDWEPRFLAPALQRALGLPVQGFLHVGGTRYLRLGAGRDAGEPVPAATVRRAVEGADFLVLHGMDDRAPAWLRQAAARVRRLLVLPDTGTYSTAPVPLSPPAGGEWYLSDDVPASPVASLLSGLDVGDLSPLAGPRLRRLPRGWWTPLVLRRGRRGVDAPMLAAREVNGRRVVVVTVTGTWRWAFTGGSAGTYDRVWSAMAGWLMGEERALEEEVVRPAHRVVARSSRVRWVAPGLSPDSLALAIRTASETVVDTVVSLVNDTATTGMLEPGHYVYRARAVRHDTVVGTASGPFSVASYSPDYTAPVVSLKESGGAAVAQPARGVPLRTMVWPYVLLLVLLIAEWTLRRRWGLR
jgi:hypothetical protein